MPSIRCEELRYDESRGPSGLDDESGTAVVEFIGDANTTTTTPLASAIVFGPAARAMNVLVRSLRGQAYVTVGAAPVATAANSVLIEIDGEAALKLGKGESIAALAASVV